MAATLSPMTVSVMPATPHYKGSLFITVERGHAFEDGMIWVSNDAKGRPTVTVSLGSQSHTTRPHTTGGLEPRWWQTFQFAVNNNGSDLIDIRVHVVVEEVKKCIGIYSGELAMFLSHVGPQWYQIRRPQTFDAEHRHGTVHGEIRINSRWFPDGLNIPPAVVALLTAPPPITPSTSSSSLSSASSTNGAGGSASPLPQQQQLPAGLTHTRSTSSTSSSPSTTTGPPVLNGHSLSLPSSSSSSSMVKSPSYQRLSSFDHHAMATKMPVFTEEQLKYPLQPIPPTPFIFSSAIFGRILADTVYFDDRNFLEQNAGVSRIVDILVWGVNTIEAMQTVYDIQGQRVVGPKYGAALMSPSILSLSSSHKEYVVSIGGSRSESGIIGLTIVTSRQRKSFGAISMGEFGDDFAISADKGHRIVCFHGGYNQTMINNIGICHQEIIARK